jgi:hypothetical protein
MVERAGGVLDAQLLCFATIGLIVPPPKRNLTHPGYRTIVENGRQNQNRYGRRPIDGRGKDSKEQ